jgi:UDP-N-acetylglucosamine:LPS N-acetylglucosamine transferase
MVLDAELDGRVLAGRIEGLFSDADRLRAMGERASTWARPDAAEALARVVLEAGDGA